MKAHLIAVAFVCGPAMADDIAWIEIQPGISVGGQPRVEIPIRTAQPGVVMTYRIRMPVANCWTKKGRIEMLAMNEDKVLGSVEIGKSKSAELFSDVLCSVVSEKP